MNREAIAKWLFERSRKRALDAVGLPETAVKHAIWENTDQESWLADADAFLEAFKVRTSRIVYVAYYETDKSRANPPRTPFYLSDYTLDGLIRYAQDYLEGVEGAKITRIEKVTTISSEDRQPVDIPDHVL